VGILKSFHDRVKIWVPFTSQCRQIMSSTATAAQSTRHGWVVQVLVHFAAVLVILIALWLLGSEQTMQIFYPKLFLKHLAVTCKIIASGGETDLL